jgi:hypothetical protein
MNTTTRNNRLTLLLIAGLPVTMTLLATWLWYYVVSGKVDLVDLLGTANQGELLTPPLPLQDYELRGRDGEAVELFPPGNGLWRILIPGRQSCDRDCEQDLYTSRQLRTAMGKYSNRIERIYLARDRGAALGFPAELQQQHPGLKVLYTSGAAASGAVASGAVASGAVASGEDLWNALDGNRLAGVPTSWFLVDPRGWIMMFYPVGTDGKAVMADLKFLLKNSSG